MTELKLALLFWNTVVMIKILNYQL